jgi:predicted acyltransferase
MSSATPITLKAQERLPELRHGLAGRLLSLDLFRGATIALMILVNNPGDEQAAYWPLKHAEWNGWTPTDLVFPFFLFIVGVSMTFSFSSRLERGETKRQLFIHVLKRGLVLLALGIFLNGFPNHYQLSTWRFYGVLQRIAICYVISAILVLWMGRRGWIIAIISCLAGYWILMRFISVPGFGIPTHDIPLLDPDRNLAAWLDRKLLMGHLYEVTRDPEGVLSTIPAIATSLLGVLTGEWLRSVRSAQAKATGMAIFGIAGLALGEFLNRWFPINKNLWTSSYVVFTAGFALVCLAICYWILDVKRWRRGTQPLLVFGANPIAAYCFAEIVAHWIDRVQVHSIAGPMTWQEMIYQRLFVSLASPANSSLLYSLAFVLMCWLPMWLLYRRQIFLKL